MITPSHIVYFVGPLLGYLLGSIPFALLIGKAHGVDIRKVGSGNVGATNLGRTLGMRFFWQAFFLDAAKGFLPVFGMSLLVAYWNSRGVDVDTSHSSLFGHTLSSPHVVRVEYPSWAPLLSGAAAMIGHIFPVWLKFKGGKGVATSFGIVLGLWPLYTVAGLLAGLTFVVIFMGYRYISLASIFSAMAFAFYVFFFGTYTRLPLLGDKLYTPPEHLYPLAYIAIGLAALIVIKHHTNIVRLIKGTEPKFGQKKQ